jgi:outer membrane protein
MNAEAMKILMIRVIAAVLASAALLVTHAVAFAQQPPAALTLEDAIALARQNNPEFRIQRNAQVTADWGARAAYGLVLPRVNVSTGMQYQAQGTQTFGLLTAEDIGLGTTPAYYFSNYNVGINLNLSGATFFRMAEQRAARSATYARVEAADYALMSDITRQYLSAMRARDGVLLAERQLESTLEAHRLAEARFSAGDGTRLDVAQAEVDHGRAQVGLLQAHNDLENQKTLLLQRMGVAIDAEFELISEFEVFEPRWSREDLLAEALTSQPQLRAAQAAEHAGRAQARAARMSYLPSINAFGQLSGYTRQSSDVGFLIEGARDQAEARIANCQLWNTLSDGLSSPLPNRPANCMQFALTPEQEQRIAERNAVFPFDFTRSPTTFGVSISLPIMDGFTRELNVQTARIAASDAQERRRAEELAVRARVTSALRAVEVSYATVALEERNAAAAGEQLELARERYRLGAGSILELTQAQAQKATADQRLLDTLYSFHEGLADLEAAVGRRLR